MQVESKPCASETKTEEWFAKTEQRLKGWYDEIRVLENNATELHTEYFHEKIKAAPWPEGTGQVSWTQYTPGFNDGEPCRFGVGEMLVHTEDEVEEGADMYEDSYPYDENPSLNVVSEYFGNLLGFTSEDLLEKMFGDGVRVMIRKGKDGVIRAETEEYYDG